MDWNDDNLLFNVLIDFFNHSPLTQTEKSRPFEGGVVVGQIEVRR